MDQTQTQWPRGGGYTSSHLKSKIKQYKSLDIELWPHLKTHGFSRLLSAVFFPTYLFLSRLSYEKSPFDAILLNNQLDLWVCRVEAWDVRI